LGVAAIYQQPALLPDLTVAENVALGYEGGGLLRRVGWRARRRRTRELLARVGARIDPDAVVSRLRMAEQQLVEIARALGTEARVLIMDEPTASLSGRDAEHLFAVIRELRARGAGIVYVSHRLEEIFALADRVTVLRDGALVASCALAEVDRARLIRLMVGREIASVFPERTGTRGEPVLEARGLACRAGGLREASLTLHAGEILGLAGLVGSGRTELARTLFGLTPADHGEILLRGRAVRIGSPARAVSLGIAYVPEDRRRHAVIGELPVAANLTLAILRELSRWGLLDREEERRQAGAMAARLGVRAASLDVPVATLSGGNQQKVALGRWLATRPSVLLLDEPTQGIDVGAKAEIYRLIVELAEQGLAMLMISSELPEVLGMSDRVAVMHEGRLVGVLSRERATPEAVLGLALGEGGVPAPPGAEAAPAG
ncbi:MAG TPA: sugar ABC transporter ATP-binding protein, partial [Vicinamibacteria bacterium]|nr:sugar ABC transporter ATP-binding protein [Vicinamibacteria bacterium]